LIGLLSIGWFGKRGSGRLGTAGPEKERGATPVSPAGLVGLGFEIAIPVVLFMYAGYRLDGWLDSRPWFLSLGALLGVAVGFYSFVRRVLPTKPRRDGNEE